MPRGLHRESELHRVLSKHRWLSNVLLSVPIDCDPGDRATGRSRSRACDRSTDHRSAPCDVSDPPRERHCHDARPARRSGDLHRRPRTLGRVHRRDRRNLDLVDSAARLPAAASAGDVPAPHDRCGRSSATPRGVGGGLRRRCRVLRVLQRAEPSTTRPTSGSGGRPCTSLVDVRRHRARQRSRCRNDRVFGWPGRGNDRMDIRAMGQPRSSLLAAS